MEGGAFDGRMSDMYAWEGTWSKGSTIAKYLLRESRGCGIRSIRAAYSVHP